MKRPCEDGGPEESIAARRETLRSGRIRCGSPTTTATAQVTARKRRRGIIEKRRRDRINSSLSELRRLIPTAVEKQGSAKLEKAEILQMTVDHLKMLQATGGTGHAHALALDFLSLGFRECVTEVSCYLSAVEGLDSSDPLRRRLLSHLSCCASQRDAAAMMAAGRPLPPQHWTPRPLPYGAPQRLAELSQHSVASTTPLSASLFSFPASFPIAFHGAFPFLPPSSSAAAATSPPISSSSSSQTPHSSSKAHQPWGSEVGAF